MLYVITTPQPLSIRSVYVANGGPVKTVASIVDHVPLPVTVVQDQMLMIVKTV